jgi:hypothetical protein
MFRKKWSEMAREIPARTVIARALLLIGVSVICAAGVSGPTSTWAQAVPGPLQQQNQGPVTTPQIQPFSAPTSGLPANILTPSTTNQLEPSSGPSPSFNRLQTFGGAGRGLPGMPGGPPLQAPMGAQDPTADYMRPPVIGPLFCDPAVNIPC